MVALFSSPAEARLRKQDWDEARHVIEESLRAESASLREKAALALAEFPFPDEKVLLGDALRDRDEYVRIAAARTLLRKGDSSGLSALQDIYQNTPYPTGPNPVVVEFQSMAIAKKRASAVMALGESSDPRAAALLRKALEDNDGRVRDAATAALARQGEKSRLIPFHTAANSADEAVRVAAFEALAQIADRSSEPHFRAGLRDPSGAVRSAALTGIQKLGVSDRWQEVLPLLKDNSALVRERAADTLGRMGTREAAPGLRLLLEDNNGFVRITAAAALARLGEKDGSEALKGFRAADDAEARGKAIEALAEFLPEKQLDLVGSALNDPDGRVRLAAASGLWKRQGRSKK